MRKVEKVQKTIKIRRRKTKIAQSSLCYWNKLLQGKDWKRKVKLTLKLKLQYKIKKVGIVNKLMQFWKEDFFKLPNKASKKLIKLL